MKRLFTILLVFCAAISYAQVRISGTAYQVPDAAGIDYLYIVADMANCEINVSESNASWYVLNDNGDSTLVASGVDYLYPEHGNTYLVNANGARLASVAIIAYDSIRLSDADANITYATYDEDQCERVYIQLEGNIPLLQYRGANNHVYTIDRKATISYHTLNWSGEAWNDTVVARPVIISKIMSVDAPLCNTAFVLAFDSLATYLGLPLDSLYTADYTAVAVAAHLQTITTIRGTEAENRYSNESNRPKEDTQLTGSAPLDILFKSNANKPVATYFDWTISKGNDVIFRRTEEDHRYTFTEAGTYKVQLVVSNAYCVTPVMDTIVTVTVSKLKVPNVFTPNGDGKNDEFRVAYESIIKFDCWVYNRWGHLVFHWSDPAKGWDGTINGRPASVGAYYYIIKATGADGLQYEMKGDINLVGR